MATNEVTKSQTQVVTNRRPETIPERGKNTWFKMNLVYCPTMLTLKSEGTVDL